MKVLAAMAALAITLGLNGTAEIWELHPDQNWVQSTAAPVVDERTCVTIPVHVEDDGDLFLGPESERTFTGGSTISDIRASMVGHFMNIAFGQENVDSWDMVLSSIDVTGMDKVTICE